MAAAVDQKYLDAAARPGTSAGLACVAGGLLLGTFMRARPAMLLALALAIPILVVAIITPGAGLPLPIGGIALLAHLDTATAVLLVLASAGLERANL